MPLPAALCAPRAAALWAAALLLQPVSPEQPEFGWGDRWPPNHLWPADVRANLRLPRAPAAGRSAAVAIVPWYRRDLAPGPHGSAVAMYCGDAVTPVGNVQRISATQAQGVYAFEPVCGAARMIQQRVVGELGGLAAALGVDDQLARATLRGRAKVEGLDLRDELHGAFTVR